MFRDNLRKKLSEKGFEIKEFAQFVNIPYPTFRRFVESKAQLPSLENAMKIAAGLGTTVEQLYYGDEWLNESVINEVCAVPISHQGTVRSVLHFANEQLRA